MPVIGRPELYALALVAGFTVAVGLALELAIVVVRMLWGAR